jgi:hypothetical protein
LSPESRAAWTAQLHMAMGIATAAALVEKHALGAPSIAFDLRRVARRMREEAEEFLGKPPAQEGEG